MSDYKRLGGWMMLYMAFLLVALITNLRNFPTVVGYFTDPLFQVRMELIPAEKMLCWVMLISIIYGCIEVCYALFFLFQKNRNGWIWT
ncbi:MAG: hypothetical protein LBR25_03620 [Erysipelotrichaceae bacterium]|jgi:hypothetical protein|nr:hypothetical protein [Erysipelotrichaceae bacterium]